MNSIADILAQNKMILDAIEILVNKYIGAQLFHKCGIVKVVDKIVPNDEYTYPDTLLSRLPGDISEARQGINPSLFSAFFELAVETFYHGNPTDKLWKGRFQVFGIDGSNH